LNGADQLAASMRTYKEPAILISTHTLSCSLDPGSTGMRYRHEVEQLWPAILLKICRYSLHFPNIHITSNNTNRAAGNSNNKVMNRRSSSAADRTVGPRRSFPLVLGRRISIRGVWQPRGTARHGTARAPRGESDAAKTRPPSGSHGGSRRAVRRTGHNEQKESVFHARKRQAWNAATSLLEDAAALPSVSLSLTRGAFNPPPARARNPTCVPSFFKKSTYCDFFFKISRRNFLHSLYT
jgi:hypothetical protein